MNYKDQSYGVVPVFKNGDDFQFLLIHHAGGHWAFPKGHSIGDETPVETAQRELFEETGVKNCKILENISFEERYSFENEDKLYDKVVTYFLGFVPDKETTTPSDFKKEIPDIKWVGYEDGLNFLTYATAKEILRKAYDLLKHQKDDVQKLAALTISESPHQENQ